MLFNPVLYRAQRSLRRRATAYVDVAVVGVTAIRMPSPIQLPIKRIQVDVGQQRRQRPTLRRALLAGRHHSVRKRSPPQISPDQPKHPFVSNGNRNAAPQDVVVHVVEELRDVYIHHPLLPFSDELLRGLHCILCAAPRAKAVATIAEHRIADRRQHLQQQLLYPPVLYRRDSQRPRPAARIRYLYRPHRTRPIGPGQQLRFDQRPCT